MRVRKILRGVNMLADAVTVTLGPGPQRRTRKELRALTVTKDGVTVAKEIELEDKSENMGAQMVKEVASDSMSPGTAHHRDRARPLIYRGLAMVAAGMTRCRPSVASLCCRSDHRRAQEPVKPTGPQIARVDHLGQQRSTIGDIIAEAMEGGGRRSHGRGPWARDHARSGRGHAVRPRHLSSPYFVTDPERMESKLEDAYVLIHEKKISSMKDLLPILEGIAKTGKPFLLVAEEVEGEALATLVSTNWRTRYLCTAVKAWALAIAAQSDARDIAIPDGAARSSPRTRAAPSEP
jgi:chaperonin GroEL